MLSDRFGTNTARHALGKSQLRHVSTDVNGAELRRSVNTLLMTDNFSPR